MIWGLGFGTIIKGWVFKTAAAICMTLLEKLIVHKRYLYLNAFSVKTCYYIHPLCGASDNT